MKRATANVFYRDYYLAQLAVVGAAKEMNQLYISLTTVTVA